MAELLTAIALLCQVNSGMSYSPSDVDKAQAVCQKYYAKCFKEMAVRNDKNLLDCVIDRK